MSQAKLSCQICEAVIEGKPFSLSSLTEPHQVLKVCETCAGSEDVTLYHAGIEVEVRRDDYLVADKERFAYTVEKLWEVAEECGWKLESVTLQGQTDAISDPVDDLF